jgi:hypothetical protein
MSGLGIDLEARSSAEMDIGKISDNRTEGSVFSN